LQPRLLILDPFVRLHRIDENVVVPWGDDDEGRLGPLPGRGARRPDANAVPGLARVVPIASELPIRSAWSN
jgi:hypothetical protein